MTLNLQLDLGFKKAPAAYPGPNPGMVYDVMVLGGGPAGLNAALYAKRKGLSVVVIAGRVGGQVTDTSSVENYLGTETLSGEALAKRFADQLETLEVPILEGRTVERFKSSEGLQQAWLDDGTAYTGKTVIIAMGSRPRRLGIPGEERLAGRGVAYCAICDGPLFKGRTVTVAGGGNSAVEAALDLAKVAGSVHLVHRSRLRADAVLVRQLESTPNITVHLETQLLEAVGEGVLSGVRIQEAGDEAPHVLPTDGLFVEIGYLPNTAVFQEVISLNSRGEIPIDARNQTGLPGIFAAGDITDVPYKQIVIAAGEGAKAALSASEYLNKLTESAQAEPTR